MGRRRLLFSLVLLGLGLLSVPTAIGQSSGGSGGGSACPTMKCVRGVNICATQPVAGNSEVKQGTTFRP